MKNQATYHAIGKTSSSKWASRDDVDLTVLLPLNRRNVVGAQIDAVAPCARQRITPNSECFAIGRQVAVRQALAIVEADGADDFATGAMWMMSSRKGGDFRRVPTSLMVDKGATEARDNPVLLLVPDVRKQHCQR